VEHIEVVGESSGFLARVENESPGEVAFLGAVADDDGEDFGLELR